MKFLAPSLLLYLSLLLNDAPIAQAIRLPIQGRIGGFGSSGLARRASISGTPDLSNQGNLQYQTNITVNGQQFQVLIDTGRCVPLHTKVAASVLTDGMRVQFRLVCCGKRKRCEGYREDWFGHLCHWCH